MQLLLNFDEDLNLEYFTNKYKNLTIDQSLFILNNGLLPDKKVELNDNNFLLVGDYNKYYELKKLGFDNLNDKYKLKYKQLERKLMKGGIL
jgi:hypothetical protein